MPFEGNAATSGKQRNSKMQSQTVGLGIDLSAGTVTSDNVRLVGLPNLSIVLDNVGSANQATAQVQVTIDGTNWINMPLLTVAANQSGYLAWITGAQLARVLIAGNAADTPNYILSSAA